MHGCFINRVFGLSGGHALQNAFVIACFENTSCTSSNQHTPWVMNKGNLVLMGHEYISKSKLFLLVHILT